MADATAPEPADPDETEISSDDLDAIAGGIVIMGHGGNGGAGSVGPNVSPPA